MQMYYKILSSLLLAVIGFTASAQCTYTWTNATANNNWNTAGNWTVTGGGGCTAPAPATGAANATLVFNAGISGTTTNVPATISGYNTITVNASVRLTALSVSTNLTINGIGGFLRFTDGTANGTDLISYASNTLSLTIAGDISVQVDEDIAFRNNNTLTVQTGASLVVQGRLADGNGNSPVIVANGSITATGGYYPGNDAGGGNSGAISGSGSFTATPCNNCPACGTPCPIGTLPVELLSFSANSTEAGTVELAWTTASELNNDYFVLQRNISPSEAGELLSLATLIGAGSTTELTDYAHTDANPGTGKNYYRLKQVDYDGRTEYTGWLEVDVEQAAVGMRAYPSPVRKGDKIFISFGADGVKIATLHLVKTDGSQQVDQQISNLGESNLAAIATDTLAPGLYVLQLNVGNRVLSQRVMVTE